MDEESQAEIELSPPECRPERAPDQQAEGIAGDIVDFQIVLGSTQLPRCGADPGTTFDDKIYNLTGPQAEPEAGYWLLKPKLRVPTLKELTDLTDDQNSEFYVPPYPRDPKFLEWEIAELLYLQRHRNDPLSAMPAAFGVPPPASTLPADFLDTTRLPLSDFIQLREPPFGAVFNIADRAQYIRGNINQQHLRRQLFQGGSLPPVVRTGRELARMFEEETPGLIHHHALDYLLYKRTEIAPPRQARIRMALSLAIYSALDAVWYYKWGASPATHSYRQRPYEYVRLQPAPDLDLGAGMTTVFRVLFDNIVGDLGRFDRCQRPGPCPSPGTPRHPAYGSGHSTYSAAASEVLAYFFPEEAAQFRMLANNIGTARLWAGVHWRSDHAAGARIGRAIAKLILDQLKADCVPSLLEPVPDTPPSHSDLKNQAKKRRTAKPCPDAETQDQAGTQRDTPYDFCKEERTTF